MEVKETNEQEGSSLATEFDSKSFMESDTMDGNANQKSEDRDDYNDDESEDDDTNEEENSEGDDDSEDDDSSDWEVEQEDNSSNKSTNEKDDDEDEEGETEVSAGWEGIAESLGIDADDYDTFIDTLKNQQSLAAKGATNEKITGLTQLIGLDDETLMRKELDARGFNSDEIEDEIDVLIENNTLRSKAREVRKDLESVVQNERNAMANNQDIDATQQADLEEATREITEYMSKTNEMFGGKINSKQKAEHTEYLTSGDFFEEISSSSENMAQAAWLWRYKDQILKGAKSSGVEKGKSSILDKMIHPETMRRTNVPDPETGDFNPSRFTDSETM